MMLIYLIFGLHNYKLAKSICKQGYAKMIPPRIHSSENERNNGVARILRVATNNGRECLSKTPRTMGQWDHAMYVAKNRKMHEIDGGLSLYGGYCLQIIHNRAHETAGSNA